MVAVAAAISGMLPSSPNEEIPKVMPMPNAASKNTIAMTLYQGLVFSSFFSGFEKV